MKLYWGAAAVLGALFATVKADLGSAAAMMPPCALNCMVESIRTSTCPPTNATCICTNPELNEEIELCIKTHCTVRESLTTKNISMTTCGAPVRDNTMVVSVIGMIGGVLAIIAVTLRLISRLPNFGGGRFGLDDWFMILTMGMVIPLTALSVVLADLGLGKDMWTVPFDNITRILYIFYFDESLYLCSIMMVKISILFLYLRIFEDRMFRRWVYVLMALATAYAIISVLISVFQCTPIHIAWEHWDGEHNGRCNNINAQAWVSAIMNIILDIVTIALPLPQLRKLNMDIKLKVQVVAMFSVGFFVTIVSILRLRSLILFGTTQNVTWDLAEVGYWSTVEVHASIICACMPAIHFLFRRLRRGNQPPTKPGTPGPSQSMGSSAFASKSRNKDDLEFIRLVDVETVVDPSNQDGQSTHSHHKPGEP